MTANSLAALIHEIEQGSECATCNWYAALPPDERVLFDQYVQRSTTDQRFTLVKLHGKCVEMGYPMKVTAFRDCVRRHHVNR